MFNIARRWHVFRSLTWKQRRRYYRFRFDRTWGQMWRFPFLVAVYPIARLLGRQNIRFLTSRRGPPRIGHLAWEIHFYVKGMRIGMWDRERPIFLASSGLVANECLRDYWATCLPVVKNSLLTILMRPFNWSGLTRRNLYPTDVEIRTEDGKLLRGLRAVDHVFIQYDRRFGDTPLLELEAGHRARGWNALESLGVPRDAWFAALHVREPGFVSKHEERRPRDGNVADFLDAVRMITDKGGWVIRLGNPGMTRLPELPNVIDYAFSDRRSADTDIFLLGECRMFLGTDSGPCDVTPLFGRPNAMVGHLPVGLGAQHRSDTYLPNTFWSKDCGRLLTFPEIMNSNIRDHNTYAEFKRSRVEVVHPEPQMITKLAIEVLARVEGTAEYDDTDDRLQERWRELLFARETANTRGELSRVGRDFLREHEELLSTTAILEDPVNLEP
jgi:putative glycosyltransferase (TIGR04372 family)